MRIIVAATIVVCWIFSCVTADARPAAWCGWYMQQYSGVTSQGTGRNLNLAREWANVGAPAAGPAPGVVVVWRHHVGVIAGQAPNGKWLVHSGNDGHAVRTRPRPLRGVIAYRNIGVSTGSAYANLKWQEQAARGRDKHLVALAVEGGHGGLTTLKKTRPVADVTSKSLVSFWHTTALTPPTETTDKPVRKKRKPVMQSQSMLLPLYTPMTEAVDSSFGKGASRGDGSFSSLRHASPHIRHGRAAARRSN